MGKTRVGNDNNNNNNNDKRRVFVINKKKSTFRIVEFTVPVNHRVKLKESKKRDKFLDLAREVKKTLKNEGDADTNCNLCTRYGYQRIVKGTGRLRNKRARGDHLDYIIIKIGQNTKKISRTLRKLVVTQTPVRNHQSKLVWKTLDRVK